MKKIKIMHIINNLGVGGAERVLYLILEELSKRKDVEIILVSLEGCGDLEEDFKKLPIRFKKFKYHLFVPYLRKFDPYFRFRLFLFTLRERPDIIHGHLIKGEDFAKLLGGFLRKPVITTTHDTMIRPGKKQKWLNRFLKKTVAVSAVAAEHLREVYGIEAQKIIIIPNGIKFSEFKNSKKKYDPKKPVFLYIGRIYKSKGIEHAIRALARLKTDFPGLVFKIYGKAVHPEDELEIKRMTKRKEYDFVKLMGKTNDVPAALKTGDIFILTSKTEGFAMGVLEAAAAGKPIIATATGAIPDIVKDGENGYLVEYGNETEIINTARKILLGNMAALGIASQNIAKEQFSIEKVARMYYNLYLENINKND
jgi:glycosyltransferase involved in cell wall biosynthesis